MIIPNSNICVEVLFHFFLFWDFHDYFKCGYYFIYIDKLGPLTKDKSFLTRNYKI